MSDVAGINQRRLFTYEEARKLLPVVRRITREAYEKVNTLAVQFEATRDQEKKTALQLEMQRLLEQWQSKIHKLGCETKGLWLVDFDNGQDYYCWRYPEPDLAYFHSYDEGFAGRKPIL